MTERDDQAQPERDHRERELKFDVPDQWLLPDPAGLLPDGGSVQQQTVRLETTYFDTADRALLGQGLTLRRREGDTDTGWHLKVPDGNARLEIRRPLSPGRGVPEALRTATHGVRAGAPLRPVATLVTEREMHRLLDADGVELAEIVLDTVTASELREFTVSRHWREVEVELADGDEQLLRRATRWLGKNGAAPSAHGSKLARALDLPPREARDLSYLSGLIGRYLDEQHEAILRGDVNLRRGVDAAATVHATRVATRRYRSVLRLLKPILDAERAGALDGELRWLAAALGDVRDRHVLRQTVQTALAELPPELVLGPVSARIQEALGKQQAEADAALMAALQTRRYYELLRELQRWRAELPLIEDGPAERIGRFVTKAERKVDRRAKSLSHDDLEGAHRVRKAAKRARYLAELARPALGKAAKRSAKQAKEKQRTLGHRQDARIAAEFLYRLGTAAGAMGENGFTYGLLYERERALAEAP